MQSLEIKSSRPRPKSFETEAETRPETFETETETRKNWSRDVFRDRDQVSRLHHCWIVPTAPPPIVSLVGRLRYQFTVLVRPPKSQVPHLPPPRRTHLPPGHGQVKKCRYNLQEKAQ